MQRKDPSESKTNSYVGNVRMLQYAKRTIPSIELLTGLTTVAHYLYYRLSNTIRLYIGSDRFITLCCRSSKQDGSVSLGMWHGWATPRHFQSPTYVDPRAAQGLETPPRTSTSHLATDPKCRPPSAQQRTKLSMATCKGQRTMEATRGNGYAPAWGSLDARHDDDEVKSKFSRISYICLLWQFVFFFAH